MLLTDDEFYKAGQHPELAQYTARYKMYPTVEQVRKALENNGGKAKYPFSQLAYNKGKYKRLRIPENLQGLLPGIPGLNPPSSVVQSVTGSGAPPKKTTGTVSKVAASSASISANAKLKRADNHEVVLSLSATNLTSRPATGPNPEPGPFDEDLDLLGVDADLESHYEAEKDRWLHEYAEPLRRLQADEGEEDPSRLRSIPSTVDAKPTPAGEGNRRGLVPPTIGSVASAALPRMTLTRG